MTFYVTKYFKAFSELNDSEFKNSGYFNFH